VFVLNLKRWVYFGVLVLFCGLLYQRFYSGTADQAESSTDVQTGFESVTAEAVDIGNADKALAAELVRQMHVADLLERRELLESALDRLFAIDPQNPAVAFFQAYIAIADDDLSAAKAVLKNRELHAANTVETRQLASYIASVSSQKDSMQQARLFQRAERYDDALVIYNQLFADGMPTLKLELERLDLLAHVKGNDAYVLGELLSLNNQYPNFAILELALADFRSRRKPSDPLALATYQRLAQGDGIGKRAADAWLRALGRLPATDSVMKDYALLAVRYPDDLNIQNAYSNVLNQQQEELERLKNPYYRAKKHGLVLLDANRLVEAEKQLRYALQGRAEDAEVLGGLGIIYLRRGDHEHAVQYFKKAAQYNEDPDQVNKWLSLIKASQYWSSLRKAEALIKKGQYEQADEQLKIALELNPAAAETYIALAELTLARGKPLRADAYYSEALRRDPGNRSALWGRVELRQALVNRRAALKLVDTEYTQFQQQRIASQLQSLKIEEEMEALNRTNPYGNVEAYLGVIERLISLKPESPWQRSDIANALVAVEEEVRADALMRDWAANDKRSEMLFSYGLYLSGRGDVSGAITALESIPEPQRSTAMQSNLMRLQLDKTLAEVQAPTTQDSLERGRILDQMAQQYHKQPTALLRLANICLDLNEHKRAEKIAATLSPDDKWAFAAQLDYGYLLLALEQFDQFIQWQQRFSLKNFSPAEQAKINELSLEYDLARAQYYAERGEIVIAYSMYQRAVENAGTGQIQARISLLKITAQMGNQAEMIAQSDDLLTASANLTASEILEIASVLQDAQALTERKRYMDVLKGRKNVGAQQLREAMLLEKQLRNWDETEQFAYAALRQARIEERPSAAGEQLNQRQLYDSADEKYWLTSSVKSTLTELRDRRDGYIKFGLDHSFRSGKDTTSQIPVEIRWPIPSLDGHLLLRVDYVTVDSGTVDYLDPDALPPSTITRIPFAESASGIALGIGWEAERWHADIGTTPLGFRKSSLVGGVGVKGSVGEVGWNAVLSQRPEVSTTLAYAGMQVPVGANFSGTEWGGVLRSGAKLGLSYDLGGANGYWASIQYHLMSGDQVEDNTRLGVLGGVYHRLIDEEDRKFRIGLNILHFQYDKNLSETTLRHGAYFSPQNYVSVSLPVRYYGRSGSTWSYLLAASVSNSWSSEDAPYLLGSGSSSGGGFGYALEAAIEKRVSDRWYVGLAADVQRADFYEPNHIVMYAKYTFTDRWQPIWTPPEPPIPYGEFD
jgi:tetratricopeptide (TPR) repeat protein